MAGAHQTDSLDTSDLGREVKYLESTYPGDCWLVRYIGGGMGAMLTLPDCGVLTHDDGWYKGDEETMGRVVE